MITGLGMGSTRLMCTHFGCIRQRLPDIGYDGRFRWTTAISESMLAEFRRGQEYLAGQNKLPAWPLKQSTVRKEKMGPGRQRVGEVDGEGTFPTFNGGYELVPPSTITVSRD